MPLFQSECKCGTILPDLRENEIACRTHFHTNGFALKTRFETEPQENSEMAYFLTGYETSFAI